MHCQDRVCASSLNFHSTPSAACLSSKNQVVPQRLVMAQAHGQAHRIFRQPHAKSMRQAHTSHAHVAAHYKLASARLRDRMKGPKRVCTWHPSCVRLLRAQLARQATQRKRIRPLVHLFSCRLHFASDLYGVLDTQEQTAASMRVSAGRLERTEN